MQGERIRRIERQYARTLLTLRSGEATRRAGRNRTVAGLVALTSLASFIWFVSAGWLPVLAFAAGGLGGTAAWVWLLARNREVRQQVILRICDWERVRRIGADGEEGSDPSRI